MLPDEIMIENNFEVKDFKEDCQGKVRETSTSPRAILDENNEPVWIMVNPDEYASMVDQIDFGKLLSLAVTRLTGVSDPEKLSFEDFLKTCELSDEFLSKDIGNDNDGDDEEDEKDPLFDD